VVEAVNFNDPLQTVIAGSKAAWKKPAKPSRPRCQARVAAAGVGAFSLQPDEAGRRESCASGWNHWNSAPQIPLINNIDVAVEVDADRIRDALYRQAFGPVRWVECIQAIQARGISTLVECGPGKVLAGMVKRIDAGLTGLALFDPASLAEAKGLAGNERRPNVKSRRKARWPW
jgi:[acyl-carrier-protein] S-malonyltransferase